MNTAPQSQEMPSEMVDVEDLAIEDMAIEDLGHPKGTLAIVLIYGALFALGWILLYFVEFIPRGTP